MRTTKPISRRSPSPGFRLAWLAPLFLLLFLWGSYTQIRSVSPAPATAPATEFSAERAMVHVEAIAVAPHPAGTEAHADARAYLMQELTRLGLTPEVQEAEVLQNLPQRAPIMARMRNVLARIPGTDSTGAVLLAAHYDSVMQGPGASDNGVAVAGLLETARALLAGPPLRNDVILLFTDGEELPLLGAQAFAESHPWGKEVAMVLNFDARGTTGSSLMFETTAQNLWVVREFARAAVHPVASSLTMEIYRRMPNGTDFTVFQHLGIPGLNFAFIGNPNHYHTWMDNADNVDLGTLQHHGVNALYPARHFGNLDLGEGRSASTEEAIYFTLPWLGLFAMPVSTALPMAIMACLVVFQALWTGFRQRRLTWGGLGLGLLALPLGSALGMGLAWAVPRLFDLPSRTRHFDLLALLFLALATLGLLAVVALLRRWTRVEALTAGTLLWWGGLSVAVTALMPGASYLFTWPLLWAAGAAGGWYRQNRDWEGLLATVLGTGPAVLIVGPMCYLAFLGLGPTMPYPAVGLAVLLLSLLLPYLALLPDRAARAVPGTALAAAAVALVLLFAAPHSGQNPQVVHLFYSMNGDEQRAYWVSQDPQPIDWVRQFVGAEPREGVLPTIFPYLPGQTFRYAEAPLLDHPGPVVTRLSDQITGPVREIRLQVQPGRVAPMLGLLVRGTPLLGVWAQGKEIMPPRPADDPNWYDFRLDYAAPAPEGYELVLWVQPEHPVQLWAVESAPGLPALAGQPAPVLPGDTVFTQMRSGGTTLNVRSFPF